MRRDVDELQQALELRRVAMLQRADDITSQMASAVFKQEEQVCACVCVCVRVCVCVCVCVSHVTLCVQMLKDVAVYSAVLARTSLAQTPGGGGGDDDDDDDDDNDDLMVWRVMDEMVCGDCSAGYEVHLIEELDSIKAQV